MAYNGGHLRNSVCVCEHFPSLIVLLHSISFVFIAVVVLIHAFNTRLMAESEMKKFKPHDGFAAYAGIACGRGISSGYSFKVEGLARTIAAVLPEMNDTFGGSIRANGAIKVCGNGYINGNLLYAPGSGVSITENAVVSGVVEQATELFECSINDISDLIEYVSSTNDNAKMSLTDSGRFPWGCSDLPEESHEWDFCLKDNEVITIPTGTYWFTSWQQSGSSKVLFDGYARILVSGSIILQESSSINPAGNAYDVLIFHFPESNNGIIIAGTVQLSGLIYSPNEKIHLSGQSIVKGGLIADEIVLPNLSDFRF